MRKKRTLLIQHPSIFIKKLSDYVRIYIPRLSYHKSLMKLLSLTILCFSLAIVARAQNAETTIKTYLGGYEKKDWNMTSSQLADGFTFTSPNHDDHIPIAVYKERCWPQSQHFKKLEFSQIIASGDHAFAIYNVTTTDNKIIRNTDYYTFRNGKILSVECFFGGTGAGFPTNAK